MSGQRMEFASKMENVWLEVLRSETSRT
jgi:hypothetical protein